MRETESFDKRLREKESMKERALVLYERESNLVEFSRTKSRKSARKTQTVLDSLVRVALAAPRHKPTHILIHAHILSVYVFIRCNETRPRISFQQPPGRLLFLFFFSFQRIIISTFFSLSSSRLEVSLFFAESNQNLPSTLKIWRNHRKHDNWPTFSECKKISQIFANYLAKMNLNVAVTEVVETLSCIWINIIGKMIFTMQTSRVLFGRVHL